MPAMLLRSRHPLLYPTLAFLVGIAADRAWEVPAAGPVALAAAGSVLVVAALGAVRTAAALLLVASAAAGAYRHDVSWRQYPSDHLLFTLPAQGGVAEVEGLVTDLPIHKHADRGPMASAVRPGGRIRFTLAAERLHLADGVVPVQGNIAWVVIDPDDRPPAFTAGQRIRVVGVLRRVGGPANPGEVDWREFHAARRTLWRGFCESVDAVRTLEAEHDDAGLRTLGRIRSRARSVVAESNLEPADRAFLGALLLGDKAQLEPELMDDLSLTGTTYFIVVSGQHVMLAVLCVFVVLRKLLGTRGAAIASLAVPLLSVIVIEPQPPVLRSAVTAAALLGGLAVGRRTQFLNSLALAALVVLWVNPVDLFDVGFQLSFLCTLALVMLGPRILTAIFGESLSPGQTADPDHRYLGRRWTDVRGLLRLPAMWISINLAAWLFAAPLTCFRFHTVSLINPLVSLPANLMVCGSLIVGLAALVVAPLPGPLSDWLFQLAALFGRWFCSWIRWSAEFKSFHLRTPEVDAFTAAAAYAVLVAWLARHRLGLPRSRIAAGFAVVLAWHAVVANRGEPDGSPLRVTVLSVGHGLCIAGTVPDGPAWMYDAGTTRPGDLARGTVRRFLDHRRFRSLDLLFISHADFDHFSAVPGLLARGPVGRVLSNPYLRPSSQGRPAAEELLKILTQRDREPQSLARGDTFDLGPRTAARVLWPPRGLATPLLVNDGSLVIKIEHEGTSLLLTGDIGPAAQTVLRTDPDIRADVLIMPHHGSTTGDPEAFLKAVGASVIVISAENRRSARLDALLASLPAGVVVHHTARDGAVDLEFSSAGIRVIPFRPDRRTADASDDE